MPPTTFSVMLNKTNPMGYYVAGQVISGKVILVLDEDKITQGLKLKLTGEAVVDWHEFNESPHAPKRYHNEESYISKKIFLVGDEKGSKITIPAGSHEYPFTFQLPQNLPCSFESHTGRVRYQIEATVKKSGISGDYITNTIFTVITDLDLNQHPVYAEPQVAINEKSIRCLCFKQGNISIRVEIPRSGFCPGEMILFSVYCSNSSSRYIVPVLYLRKDITYVGIGKSKHVSHELVAMKGPEVTPFGSESWRDQLQIPQVPPTNLGGCKIIQVTCSLQFEIEIPSSFNLNMKIPLMIGTIPFTNFAA